MIQPVLKLDRKQIVNLLAQYPENDLKDIFSDLINLRLYKPPKFDDITEIAKRIVNKEKLNPQIIDDAITWAREKR